MPCSSVCIRLELQYVIINLTLLGLATIEVRIELPEKIGVRGVCVYLFSQLVILANNI